MDHSFWTKTYKKNTSLTECLIYFWLDFNIQQDITVILQIDIDELKCSLATFKETTSSILGPTVASNGYLLPMDKVAIAEELHSFFVLFFGGKFLDMENELLHFVLVITEILQKSTTTLTVWVRVTAGLLCLCFGLYNLTSSFHKMVIRV